MINSDKINKTYYSLECSFCLLDLAVFLACLKIETCIKSVSLEYSCDEEYLKEFNRGKI